MLLNINNSVNNFI